MRQIEIEYFFPLTEQISLDLDFSECSPHQYWLRAQGIAGQHGPFPVGMQYKNNVLVSNGSTATWSQRIGDWEIPNEKKQPSKLQKFLMKYFLGWKWMGK